MGSGGPPGIDRAAPGELLNTLQSEQNTKRYRNYIFDVGGTRPVRHRGKSPQQPAFFTRSTRARQESAVLASIFCLTGTLPRPAAPEAARSLATPARGELLCQAYESYRSEFSSPQFSFEHAVFLLAALWRADELILGACRDCSAVLVADRWSLRAPRCLVCVPPARLPGSPP